MTTVDLVGIKLNFRLTRQTLQGQAQQAVRREGCRVSDPDPHGSA
jgi:hypothetical protein